jgi:hypothetical protein
MLNVVKQVRSAFSLLKPDEVRERAERPVHIGLVAASDAAYREMEEFLTPSATAGEGPVRLADFVHRAGDPGAPDTVDFVLYEQGVPRPKEVYTFYSRDPDSTVAGILAGNQELELALARRFPVFRKRVVEGIIQAVARENAFFSVVTALPDVFPTLAELPWVFGEFASDTAFLTGNQVRMAFQIAAACGKEVGFAAQKAEIAGIAATAFGWRAIARELAGKIPFGAGLIPKGGIAYAGTFVVGKGLERLHGANQPMTRRERQELYRQALLQGRSVAESVTAGFERPA